MLCGLLWSAAVFQMAAFADHAGPARETLLLMAVGAAVVCLFFTTPSLPSLITVGPAAIAGPLIFLFLRPQTTAIAQAAWGAFALASMLSLILNASLRRQFALFAEREQLAGERATSLEEAERLARSKSALIATLSHGSATASPASPTCWPPPQARAGGPRRRASSPPPRSPPPTISSPCSTPPSTRSPPRPAG